MKTKINKELHLSLLNIIETVDKNEEQLKALIKKSIFADTNIPDEDKDEAVTMYTAQLFEMRNKFSGTVSTPEVRTGNIIVS